MLRKGAITHQTVSFRIVIFIPKFREKHTYIQREKKPNLCDIFQILNYR